MNLKSAIVTICCSSVLLLPSAEAADNSIVGEWFPAENSSSGLGAIRHYETNGTVSMTLGAAIHFQYALRTNGESKSVMMPGPNGESAWMDFTIAGDNLEFRGSQGRQQQSLTRVGGTVGQGLIGKWTGKHYTGGTQVMEFTTNSICYVSVPFQTLTGAYTVDGDTLIEEHDGNRATSSWQITNGVLTLTPASGQKVEKYRRKGWPLPEDGKVADAVKLPEGIRITSEGKDYVHADLSGLSVDEFPTLTNIHALFTVYFYRNGATDEKLMAMSQLHFTNLASVVFTDCPRVTDKGIEYLSRIRTLKSLGLRQMNLTDAVCDVIVDQMRIEVVNMPHCANVTAKGLLKMAQSESMESLGFSVGNMTQDDLMRIIQNAGSKLERMDIEMSESAEQRLDLAALREAGVAKEMKLYAVRNRSVSKL